MSDHDDLNRDLNALHDWSLKTSQLEYEARHRCFSDYIAWKIPFPENYSDGSPKYRAIRAFCVERLICKLILLTSWRLKLEEDTEIIRGYSIISEPNLWASEIGLVFSENKWKNMLYRDIKTPVYSEITYPTNQTLFEAFGVQKPKEISHLHLSHVIEDKEEEIYFRGGLHVVWREAPLLPSDTFD